MEENRSEKAFMATFVFVDFYEFLPELGPGMYACWSNSSSSSTVVEIEVAIIATKREDLLTYPDPLVERKYRDIYIVPVG